jgi:hypothetical protein
MKALVSMIEFDCSGGLDELGGLEHISFGSLWVGFNNQKASPRRRFSRK